MNQLNNPSVTSPRMGDRSRASRVSPRNRTGQIYAAQHAEAEARKAAANVDIEEVKRAEFQRGHEAGHSAGWQSAIDAIVAMYESDGIKAIQELMDELTADDDQDA